MRRAETMMMAALIMAAGCSFDTSGPSFSGPVGSTPDSAVADIGQDDLGPRPDNGGKTDGPVTPPDGPVVDQLQPDKGQPCGGKPYKCNGDNSMVCQGDKYVVFRKCAMDCHAPSGKCNTFQTLNGAGTYIAAAKGKWKITGTVKLDTTTGAFTPAQPTSAVGVASGANMRVLTVETMDLDTGALLQATGSLPLLIVANDVVTIKGTLDVSASGTVPGPGGADGGGAGKAGSGCGGGDPSAFLSGTGGNGGSYGGKGGMGNSTTPKATCGLACPTPLTGGSGGGDGDGFSGTGGAGGGALQITAARSIIVTGKINAGGGGGQGGTKPSGNGGGGGSGGAIILEAPEVKIDGVTAANGGGGGGGASITQSDGGQGQNGAASTLAAGGGSEGVSTLSGKGGKGSSQTGVNGGDSPTSPLFIAAGGGGGGAGRICVRTKSGLFSGNGDISPAGGSGAGAQQKLVVVAP